MANKTARTLARVSSGRAPRAAALAALLPPGLHVARIEALGAEDCTVRTLDGLALRAVCEVGVAPELLAECRRDGRSVLVCRGPHGPVVVGALQTTPSLGHREGERLCFDAAEVKLRAEQRLSIEAGPVAIVVDGKGTLRLRGDKMVIDMGSLLRILAARVELP